MKLTTVLILSTLTAAFMGVDLTGNSEFQYPLIKNHGGIVPLPDAAHQPQKN